MPMRQRSVLVVDDESAHRLMVRAVLEDAGWQVTEASSGEQALQILAVESPHAALVDMRMPGMDGLALLREIKARRPELPVVLLTAFGSVGSAVEAMKKGAFDYLTKPADNEELKAVLEKSYEYRRLLDENVRLKEQVRDEDGRRLVGASPGMNRVRELISQAGPSEASVLILGESGTGKELVAEGLHLASARRGGPLVKVNCAALPAELLESELFGYVKGAFTGAFKDKPGRFQLAGGGTLFLDEIAELPAALQAIGSTTPLVAEGRDMGSVVFPEARHKFFLEATIEERAKRRFLQLQRLGQPADLARITGQIRIRDEQDRNRPIAPLAPAPDAIVIDTTELTLAQVFQRLTAALERP